MFKKQYIPFGPKKTNVKSSAEYKIISKRDEEKIKNIISEQPKIREMLNKNLQYRDDFLRSQRIINYNYDQSRLIGLENNVIRGLRFYAPPVKLDDFADSRDRKQQLDRKMEQEFINPDQRFLHNNRFF